MAKIVTTPPSCLRPPPDPPPSSCLKAPLEALSPVIPPEPPDPPDVPLLHIAAVHFLACFSSRSAAAKESRTVCSSLSPSHHCLCSYSAGKPCANSVSHNVRRMNFRSVNYDVFDLHLQTLSIKNTQILHQASSLNLASRALSIAVQSLEVKVSYWVKESIDLKLVSFQYATNQSLEDWLLIVKVSGVTCVVDFQLLPCYARPDLVIEDSEEVVSFSSAHGLLYFGYRLILVTGASFPYDHYSFLTVDILLQWSTTQSGRIYTTPTVPISCIFSEPKTCRMASISVSMSDQCVILKDKKVLYLKIYPVLRLRTSGSPSHPLIGVSVMISPSPLVHFMFTELQTVTTSIYVLFYITRVFSSTLSDQGNLLELSSYAVVLASTVSPPSPNSWLLIVFEIHLVSWRSIMGVRADLICLMGCLVKLRSSSGNFALFQTSSFGYINNVVFDYDKLFGASAAGIQVKTIFGFLYFEQASPVIISILGFIVSLLFIVPSSILVVVVLPLNMAPVVTS